MSSSTSNSESDQEAGARGRTAALRRLARCAGILLVLLLCFIGIELFTRIVLVPKSTDLRRLTSYPALAEQLLQQNGFRIALVGNSALEDGVDPEIVQEMLKKAGIGPASVQSFYVEGTHISNWYYIINHCFWRSANKPDLIVILFHYTNLCDARSPEIGRLSHYFTTTADWEELLLQDTTSRSERIEIVLSQYWLSFAVRGRIQYRVLGALVPGYMDFAQEMRAAARDRETKQPSAARSSASYRMLERLLRRAREEHTPVLFVAFPPRDGTYELSDEVVKLIHREGMELLDMRSVPCLKPDMYKDWIHMTERGRETFSPELARKIAQLIGKYQTLNEGEFNATKNRCVEKHRTAGPKT